MSLRRITVGVAIFLSAAMIAPAQAQDSHYWYDQFGNRALLLSGAVVGDPADLSSVYYNPGGLSLVEQTELLLAGLVISATNSSISDAVAGQDLGQTIFDVSPALIAGEVPLAGGKHRFAYSVLKRYGGQFEANGVSNLDGSAFDVVDLTLISNATRVNSKLSEYWVGGTWSYPVADNLGVGVSTFVAVRSQERYNTNTVQLLSNDNRALVGNVATDYSYYNWRVLWKIGAQGRVANWDVGLTVTTPSLNLFGSGNVENNLTIVGQFMTPGGAPITEIATNAQRGRAAEYRSPLSIAVGVAHDFGASAVHLSAEYFAPVDLYSVIAADPFVGQSSQKTFDVAVAEELVSVFNVGIGVERRFSDTFLGYFGFHTDYNAASENLAANLSHTKWNYYHVSGGATIGSGSGHFTLGGDLALASDEITVGSPFRPLGVSPQLDASSYRLTVLLGFSFLAQAQQ